MIGPAAEPLGARAAAQPRENGDENEEYGGGFYSARAMQDTLHAVRSVTGRRNAQAGAQSVTGNDNCRCAASHLSHRIRPERPTCANIAARNRR